MNLSYLSLLFGLICFVPKVNLDPVGDAGDVGYSTSNVIKEISSSLSTLKKNSNGVVDALSKFNKYAGLISKVAGTLGASFALIGVLGSILMPNNEHKEIMNEFKKIHESMKKLDSRFDEVIQTVKEESAKNHVVQRFREVQYHANTFKEHVIMPTNVSLLQFHPSKDISKAIKQLITELTTPFVHSSTWPQLVYQNTYGNYRTIGEMKIYFQQTIMEAVAAWTFMCTKEMVNLHNDEDWAIKECKDATIFENETKQLEEMFETLLRSCTENYYHNIDRRLENELKRKGSLSDEAFRDHMVEIINKDYFWVDAVVSVYHDVTGGDQHWTNILYKFRREHKNVAILMEPKSYDRSPFNKTKDVTILNGGSENFLKNTISEQAGRTIYQAEYLFRFIKEEMKNENIWLTVIRDTFKTRDPSIRATKDNERFFHRQYPFQGWLLLLASSPSSFHVTGLLREKSFYIFDKFRMTYGYKICPGKDILYESKTSNRECDRWCRDVTTCRGWTRNVKSGTCYLKSESKCKIPTDDWDSGVSETGTCTVPFCTWAGRP